jgi:hypothetical protein
MEKVRMYALVLSRKVQKDKRGSLRKAEVGVLACVDKYTHHLAGHFIGIFIPWYGIIIYHPQLCVFANYMAS